MNQFDDETIFHIITDDEWRLYEISGVIEPTSLQTEGFVHCSTVIQLPITIGRYYRDRQDLRVVQIAVSRLTSELRWEESHPGEFFPHVFGPIPMAAIVGKYPLD